MTDNKDSRPSAIDKLKEVKYFSFVGEPFIDDKGMPIQTYSELKEAILELHERLTKLEAAQQPTHQCEGSKCLACERSRLTEENASLKEEIEEAIDFLDSLTDERGVEANLELRDGAVDILRDALGRKKEGDK